MPTESKKLISPGPQVRHSSPLRRTRRGLAVLGLLYLTHVAIQSYQFLQSPGVHYRIGLLRAGKEMAVKLHEDKVFLFLNYSYVRGKALLDPDFSRSLHHAEFYARKTQETEQEFAESIRRIYNPLIASETPRRQQRCIP